MGVRSALASTLTRAGNSLARPGTSNGGPGLAGPGPAGMRQAAEGPSGMGHDRPFSPGEPVGPYSGYGVTPRQFDFTTSYNVATRPRTHERVAFETLRGLIDAYDVAQIAIWHRIDSIRSLDWQLVAADQYEGDTSDAIPRGLAALDKPDRVHSFSTWLAKYLFDLLAYDAGVLYRLRNRAGRVIGLSVPDGTTFAPLLDYWGNRPEPPAEAFVQYVNGLPWNWLTLNDLIYEPFRPRNNSPYGHAPLESILLNANTDLRFQLYFLQRFTEGNVPEAFASAPETWSPDQIEQFQTYWDSFILGEQSAKHQIKWIPGGSAFAWSNEKDFTDTFSLFLMRKTVAAYHVVPADLGFTETVNLSSGESQADVQHRIGDLPLGRHVEGILTRFLQRDLKLPLKFSFDWGEEQDDRLNQAEADQIYIQNAVVSASEVREMRFGLSEAAGQTVPRIFFTTRAGPVPLSSLYAVAGPTDPQTSAPAPGAVLPRTAFEEVGGVIPNPPLSTAPLAEQEYGPSALPPAPPPQPQALPLAKEAASGGEGGGPTTGVTAETGITGYDLIRGDDEDDDKAERAAVAKAALGRARLAKAELGTFRRFERARRKTGVWRDFTFEHADPVTGHRLNDAGRLAVRKDTGQIAVAGLVVQAADTGRVLMLQRALDPADPAGGTWEFPGGHLEDGEPPITAAAREWCEETGCILPFNPEAMAALAFGNGAGWVAANGIYAGFVYPVPSEDCVPVRADTAVTNPDDPDGDLVEAIAWWDPGMLPGNPAVRPELLADITAVLGALGTPPAGDPDGIPGDPAVVVKAGGGGDPKVPAWPGWALDRRTVTYWAPEVTTAAALPKARLTGLAAGWFNENPAPADNQDNGDKRDRNAAAVAWLTGQGVTFPFGDVAEGIVLDGWASGAIAATAAATGTAVDTDGWQPGDGDSARSRVETAPGAGTLLAGLPGATNTTSGKLTAAYLAVLGRTLADAQADQALTVPGLVAALASVFADKALAAGLVLTAVTAASGQAAQACYTALAVTHGRWITDPGASKTGPCPLCLTNEAAGPVPVGDPYPSGDTQAPAHDNCNCAVVPA